MGNLKSLYKIMLKHWGYVLGGLLFMFGFAAFSSVSLAMAIPLFDYVFKTDPTKVVINKFPAFWDALTTNIQAYLSAHGGFSKIMVNDNYKDLFEGLGSVFAKTEPILLLWIISFSVVSLIILKNIFFFFNRVMFTNLRGHTVRDVRDIMFKKYMYQSLAFFGKNKVGDSLVRMVGDVRIVSNFFIKSVFAVIRNVMLLFMYAALAISLNAKLFFISLILLPAFSLGISFLGNKIKKYAKRIQKQSSALFSNVEESLNSMRIVKAFSR